MPLPPGVTIDLSLDDRYADLLEQGVDLAIRMGRLADSSLGARHLGDNPWVMVAAPAYLARRGRPQTLAELALHDCLVYSSVQGDDRWSVGAPGGAPPQSIAVRGPLRSNNLSAVLAAARGGLGLAMLPWYVARESIDNGRVVPVLTDHTLASQEIHAVFPSPKLVPSKVTSFIAHLRESLQGRWWETADPG